MFLHRCTQHFPKPTRTRSFQEDAGRGPEAQRPDVRAMRILGTRLRLVGNLRSPACSGIPQSGVRRARDSGDGRRSGLVRTPPAKPARGRRAGPRAAPVVERPATGDRARWGRTDGAQTAHTTTGSARQRAETECALSAQLFSANFFTRRAVSGTASPTPLPPAEIPDRGALEGFLAPELPAAGREAYFPAGLVSATLRDRMLHAKLSCRLSAGW